MVCVWVDTPSLGPLLALVLLSNTLTALTVNVYSTLGSNPLTLASNTRPIIAVRFVGTGSLKLSGLSVVVAVISNLENEGVPVMLGLSHERTTLVAPIEFTVRLMGGDGGTEYT